ncbi:hypothetical protein CRYUN_Cryun01aG0234400 [Craigia yunnanensis]
MDCTYTSLESMKTEGSSSEICVLMANGDSTCGTILSSIIPPCYQEFYDMLQSLRPCKAIESISLWAVLHLESISDALKALQEEKARPDLVLIDVEISDLNRLELLKHVEKEFQLPATCEHLDII